MRAALAPAASERPATNYTTDPSRRPDRAARACPRRRPDPTGHHPRLPRSDRPRHVTGPRSSKTVSS